MFANSRPAEPSKHENLLPVVRTALQGIAVYVERGETAEYQQFRNRMQSILNSIAEPEAPPDLMSIVHSAVTTLRDYGQRVQRSHQQHEMEMRAVMKALIETMMELAVGSPETMRNLQAAGAGVITAKEVEDLRQSKTDLENCLAAIRKEVERSAEAAGGQEMLDSVTGLAGRPAAEAALAGACSSGAPSCAVGMLIDRLPLFNRRYGREVGDQVLSFFAEFVQQSFVPHDSLYRWTGPGLVMLRDGSIDKVQAEVRRIMEPRLQYEVDTASRTILLSIDACWNVLPMMTDPRLLINKIDGFMAG